MMKNFLYLIFVLGLSSNMLAQTAQRASHNAAKLYEQQHYSESESNYRLARSKNQQNTAYEYNLGNSLYKQNVFDEAIPTYQNAIENTATKSEKHQAYHNLGNAYMKLKKYKLAEEAFKNALRNNPKNEETRYNFALAKKLNEQNPEQENQDQQQDQDKQENKDPQQDQEQQQDQQDQKEDDSKNQDDSNSEKKEGDRKDDKNKNPDQQESPQQQASKNQMERMLEALNQQEQNVQQRLLNKDKKGEKQEVQASGSPRKDW